MLMTIMFHYPGSFQVIDRLLKDIPDIRISVLAHGDYCDKHNYVTKWVDFSNDSKALCKFVKEVGPTGGGDTPECYELALYQVGICCASFSSIHAR